MANVFLEDSERLHHILYVLDTSGNETVTAAQILEFLHENHFDIFIDHWNEQNLYFGKHGNDVMEIDKMFGE